MIRLVVNATAFVAIAILAFCVYPASAGYTGDELYAKLELGCQREWPKNRRRQVACMEWQNDAAKRLRPITQGYGNAAIFNRCWRQWEDGLNGTPDYRMVLACYRLRNAASK